MKFFGKILSLLFFIVAVLYLAGLVYMIFFGHQAPSSLRLFYPFID